MSPSISTFFNSGRTWSVTSAPISTGWEVAVAVNVWVSCPVTSNSMADRMPFWFS
jgi:hypothetical protein